MKKQLASALERARSPTGRLQASRDGSQPARRSKSGDKVLAAGGEAARGRRSGGSSVCSKCGAGSSPPSSRRMLSERRPDVDAGRTLAEVQLHLAAPRGRGEATLRRVVAAPRAGRRGRATWRFERVLGAGEQSSIRAIQLCSRRARRRRAEASARELYQRMAQYALQMATKDRGRHPLRTARGRSEPRRRRGAPAARQDVRLSPRHGARDRRIPRGHPEERSPLPGVLRSRGSVPRAATGKAGKPTVSSVASSAAPRTRSSWRARAGFRLSSISATGRSSRSSRSSCRSPSANPQRPIFRKPPRRGVRQPHVRSRATTQTCGWHARGQRRGGRAGGAGPRGWTRSEAAPRCARRRRRVRSSGSRSMCWAPGRTRTRGRALFAFATGSADTALRVRAMIACGALRASGARCSQVPARSWRGTDETPDRNGRLVAAPRGAWARMEDKRALAAWSARSRSAERPR